jgi:hypothetical protein
MAFKTVLGQSPKFGLFLFTSALCIIVKEVKKKVVRTISSLVLLFYFCFTARCVPVIFFHAKIWPIFVYIWKSRTVGIFLFRLLNNSPLFGFFLFCFVLFCFVLFCFVLFCFVLFCFVLFCFVLFCFVVLCFVVFCFVLEVYLRYLKVMHRIMRRTPLRDIRSLSMSTLAGMFHLLFIILNILFYLLFIISRYK